MKKLISKSFLTAAIAMLSFSIANAAAPVQFSFFDFNAPKDSEVTGVRFPAIYGKGGGDVTGVEINLLAYSEMNSFKGFNFPLFILSGNRVQGDMTGVSWSTWNRHEGQDTGWNWGLVNTTNNVKGLNLGAVNVGNSTHGLDLGLVNITQQLNGVQIGLVNCAKNGFLPCFIIFNFGTN